MHFTLFEKFLIFFQIFSKIMYHMFFYFNTSFVFFNAENTVFFMNHIPSSCKHIPLYS